MSSSCKKALGTKCFTKIQGEEEMTAKLPTIVSLTKKQEFTLGSRLVSHLFAKLNFIKNYCLSVRVVRSSLLSNQSRLIVAAGNFFVRISSYLIRMMLIIQSLRVYIVYTSHNWVQLYWLLSPNPVLEQPEPIQVIRMLLSVQQNWQYQRCCGW